MSVLKEICNNKKLEIKSLKEKFSQSNLLEISKYQKKPRGFKSAITSKVNNNQYALIAEVKKASPSRGIIKENFNPKDIATSYYKGGATCLSVLTEIKWFKGSIEYLIEISENVSLPILRKDFMIDKYQIYESKLIGADCILLIASILSDQQIEDFVNIAKKLQLDYLIEVHSENELRRVEHFEEALIGVNNRNLKTFEVDLDNSVRLRNLFKQKNIFIAESGIKSREDMNYLKLNNIAVFLVGESLMRGYF